MDLDITQYLLFLVVGFLAGIINTLAAGASIFVLSILLFYGFPAGIANGTNRLGLLVQNLTGTITFSKSGLFEFKTALPFIIPSIIGAILGAVIATDIDQATLEIVIGTVMILMLYPILKKPKPTSMLGKQKKGNKIISWLVFFAIGVYGGFIQAGIGIAIVVALSNLAGFSLIKSNAIKMGIILVYTIPVFSIFLFNGQVAWLVAILLALGQMLGTWFTGKFLAHHPKINLWIKWLIVAMVVITILKMIHWEIIFSKLEAFL